MEFTGSSGFSFKSSEVNVCNVSNILSPNAVKLQSTRSSINKFVIFNIGISSVISMALCDNESFVNFLALENSSPCNVLIEFHDKLMWSKRWSFENFCNLEKISKNVEKEGAKCKSSFLIVFFIGSRPVFSLFFFHWFYYFK